MWPSNTHRIELLARLRTLGIRLVQVNFQGGGDSGEISDIDTLDANSKPVSIDKDTMEWTEHSNVFDEITKQWKPVTKSVTKSLSDILEQLTCDALEEQGLDWYNNDGGQGQLTIDFSQSPPAINLHCELNITNTEDHDFDLTEEIEEQQ